MSRQVKYFINEYSKKEKNVSQRYLLKKALVLFKDYAPLIGGVPLILGGFHQIISLINIGPSYVRFFSITQLLSDGFVLLISLLLILFWMIFLFMIMFPYLFQNRFEQAKHLGDTVGKRDLMVYISFIVLYVLLVPFFIIPDLFHPIELYNLELLQFRVLILGSLILLIGNVSYWKNWASRVKFFFKSAIIILSILFFYFYLSFAFEKVSEIFIPQDLTNFNNLECLNTQKVTPEILYFNDKYVFLKEERLDEGIRVLKLEDLLKINPCKQNE